MESALWPLEIGKPFCPLLIECLTTGRSPHVKQSCFMLSQAAPSWPTCCDGIVTSWQLLSSPASTDATEAWWMALLWESSTGASSNEDISTHTRDERLEDVNEISKLFLVCVSNRCVRALTEQVRGFHKFLNHKKFVVHVTLRLYLETWVFKKNIFFLKFFWFNSPMTVTVVKTIWEMHLYCWRAQQKVHNSFNLSILFYVSACLREQPISLL